MAYPCTVTRQADARWLARHSSPRFGVVAVSGSSRDEAIQKLRSELQYRVELCPCSGVSGEVVELEVRETRNL